MRNPQFYVSGKRPVGSWSPGQAAGYTTRRTSLWIFTSYIIATADRIGCTYPGTRLSHHGSNILVIRIISRNELERSAVIGVCYINASQSEMIQTVSPEIGTLVTRGCFLKHHWRALCPLITRFMGPTWGSSGADRTQVGPMLAPMNFAIWVLIIFLICYLS